MNFDPKMQPGYENRYVSLDALLGDAVPYSSDKKRTVTVPDQRDLRKVFKTFQDPRMMPSLWNRVRGRI